MAKLKHRWFGITLAVAVAFNTLLPFFATYSDTVPPSGLASIFGEKVLICTGQGFAWVKWKDLQSGKSPVKHYKDYSCPLCYIASNATGKTLLLTAAGLLLARQHARGRSLFSSCAASLHSLACTASRPRAPPVSFSC